MDNDPCCDTTRVFERNGLYYLKNGDHQIAVPGTLLKARNKKHRTILQFSTSKGIRKYYMCEFCQKENKLVWIPHQNYVFQHIPRNHKDQCVFCNNCRSYIFKESFGAHPKHCSKQSVHRKKLFDSKSAAGEPFMSIHHSRAQKNEENPANLLCSTRLSESPPVKCPFEVKRTGMNPELTLDSINEVAPAIELQNNFHRMLSSINTPTALVNSTESNKPATSNHSSNKNEPFFNCLLQDSHTILETPVLFQSSQTSPLTHSQTFQSNSKLNTSPALRSLTIINNTPIFGDNTQHIISTTPDFNEVLMAESSNLHSSPINKQIKSSLIESTPSSLLANEEMAILHRRTLEKIAVFKELTKLNPVQESKLIGPASTQKHSAACVPVSRSVSNIIAADVTPLDPPIIMRKGRKRMNTDLESEILGDVLADFVSPIPREICIMADKLSSYMECLSADENYTPQQESQSILWRNNALDQDNGNRFIGVV
eukprot:GHVL01024536.1.p1 GENE.GHVL01024536.1~~GHVL01024536.1.p1  ORF type:complete len:484 (-),score=43.98 GHVL01024536.1:1656-3107(-)